MQRDLSKFKVIIFDLDGTIIDSAPSIIETVNFSFINCNIEPLTDITNKDIGPPLKELIRNLIKPSDIDKLDLIADAFINYYDNVGYLKTILYKPALMLIEKLSKSSRLFIATNKREAPTLKILDHLGIRHFFENVYCIDSKKFASKSKDDLLKKIIVENSLNREDINYIGDTEQDRVAAEKNNISFTKVGWAYS